LFGQRAYNRVQSPAPPALKAAVSLIEVLPGLSRLKKVQLCELFTHLFWNGGPTATSQMIVQGIRLRLRRA